MIISINNAFFGKILNFKQTFMGVDQEGKLYQFLKISFLKIEDKKIESSSR
jgi:hypothetical protein